MLIIFTSSKYIELHVALDCNTLYRANAIRTRQAPAPSTSTHHQHHATNTQQQHAAAARNSISLLIQCNLFFSTSSPPPSPSSSCINASVLLSPPWLCLCCICFCCCCSSLCPPPPPRIASCLYFISTCRRPGLLNLGQPCCFSLGREPVPPPLSVALPRA